MRSVLTKHVKVASLFKLSVLIQELLPAIAALYMWVLVLCLGISINFHY
jgi:hypothetical protein